MRRLQQVLPILSHETNRHRGRHHLVIHLLKVDAGIGEHVLVPFGEIPEDIHRRRGRHRAHNNLRSLRRGHHRGIGGHKTRGGHTGKGGGRYDAGVFQHPLYQGIGPSFRYGHVGARLGVNFHHKKVTGRLGHHLDMDAGKHEDTQRHHGQAAADG